MPILKTEILGSEIDISYEVEDLNKLSNLIENFKVRLKEFPGNGNISNSTLIFLAALKSEDELEDFKKIVSKNKATEDQVEDQKNVIKKLQKDINLLNSELKIFSKNSIIEKNNNDKLILEINELDDLIKSINLKIQESIK